MRRSRLILGSVPVGAIGGALVWLVFSHGASAPAKMDDLQTRAETLNAPMAPAQSSSSGAVALATPLFALTTGPGAVTDTTVELIGVARSPGRTAALIAINGKPAEWLALGETRDDVTLDDVQADKVTVDTPTGSKDVALGAKSLPAGGAQQAPAASNAASASSAGFHLPPPPASAPST